MKRQVSRKVLETMCGQPGPDDGVDPRDFFKPQSSRRVVRKDWQLCRQVAETLNYVLSGELNDETLRDLYVQQAEPAPDSSRVLVTVSPLSGADEVDPTLILERLQVASKRLRGEVARSISRRKSPELVFRVTLAGSLPIRTPSARPVSSGRVGEGGEGLEQLSTGDPITEESQ